MCLNKPPKITGGKTATPALAPPPPEQSAAESQGAPERASDSFDRANSKMRNRNRLRIDREDDYGPIAKYRG